MSRFVAGAIALSAFLAAAPAANAGIYGDDLTRCVVKKATAADQTALMRWLFSAMSLHPDVRANSKITDAERDAMNKSGAQVIQRLITVDCRSETVAGLKYEGSGVIEKAFGALGEVAMRQLMAQPDVAKGISGLEKHFDSSALEALAKEAGVVGGEGAKE